MCMHFCICVVLRNGTKNTHNYGNHAKLCGMCRYLHVRVRGKSHHVICQNPSKFLTSLVCIGGEDICFLLLAHQVLSGLRGLKFSTWDNSCSSGKGIALPPGECHGSFRGKRGRISFSKSMILRQMYFVRSAMCWRLSLMKLKLPSTITTTKMKYNAECTLVRKMSWSRFRGF